MPFGFGPISWAYMYPYAYWQVPPAYAVLPWCGWGWGRCRVFGWRWFLCNWWRCWWDNNRNL